ncbi:MAG: NUDIX hydrolase [Ardenticatenaceae bacterium]|nr:NUDIX hydrolase [Ardenticatenaceae bacterium]MCB9444640.1 NUDIX hydrolase [Ardenticatenaceae bacterium]
MNIRPIVICVFSHNGRILTVEGYDPLKRQIFYRPLGGGIEFGEFSQDALMREIREELNTAVTGLRYLATLENIFTFSGQPGHEIVQVYDGRFEDTTLYRRPVLKGLEDNGQPFTAFWKSLSDFEGKNAPPLYPDGLLELLRQQL